MRIGSMTPHFAAAGLLLLASFGGAQALEEVKGEKDALKTCEKNICDLVTKKAPDTGDLTCGLSKTWLKSDLKEGSAMAKMSWGYSDARCTVDLKLARATVISALKDPKATLQFADHTVNCEIEDDKKEVTKVTATLAPKAEFVDGKATKVWVNLKDVTGSSVIKGLAFTAAKLEDNVGIFHSALIKSLNHLINDKCPRVAEGK